MKRKRFNSAMLVLFISPLMCSCSLFDGNSSTETSSIGESESNTLDIPSNTDDDGQDNSNCEDFGSFPVNGQYLTSFQNADTTIFGAKEDISQNSVSEVASNLKQKNPTVNYASDDDDDDDDRVTEILDNFGYIEITSYFYEQNQETNLFEEISYSDKHSGVTLQSILTKNSVVFNEGLSANYLYLTSDILDEFKLVNLQFEESEDSNLYPFTQIYSYHEYVDQSEKQFVLQTNDFTQISSDNVGGTTCSFIQQNEIIYNKAGMAEKFQSALGIMVQSKSNTQFYGTQFRCDFNWVVKE